MMQFFSKNYFSNFFPKRYFQLREGGEVVVNRNTGGSPIAIGKHSKLFDITKLKLLDYIKTTCEPLKLHTAINDVLVRIHNDDDEALILSLINLNLHTRTEKDNLDYLQIIVDLLIMIEEEENENSSNEEERIISLLCSFFM